MERQDMEDGSSFHCDTTGSGGRRLETQKEVKAIRSTAWRTYGITVLLVVLGAACGVGFLYVGLSSAKKGQEQSFESRASEFSLEIDNAWDDYEGAIRWTHSECRNWRTDNFTYANFEALHHYLMYGGLDFFSINWVPNITKEERAQVEATQGPFWKDNIEGAENYTGFIGQEVDPDDPDQLIVTNRSEQPFYFPIYFVEPKSAAASIIHYDLYSAPWEKPIIDKAIETYQPTLTGRFILAQHTEEDGYSAVLYHPGVQLPDHLKEDRHDLAEIVMMINPFLKRAARDQTEPLTVYLYDKTATASDGTPPEFLGGVEVKYNASDDRQVILLKETEHAALQDSQLYYEREILVGGRVWSTVVVAPSDSYEQDTLFVVLFAVMIFASSLLLAWIWIAHNQHREQQVTAIVDKAAAESSIVANLFPTAVRDRMIKQHRETARAETAPKDGKDAFLNNNSSNKEEAVKNMFGSQSLEKTTEGRYKTKPMADRYEATTIMFADLAGFTAWSSTRSPEDVFTLLETLYGAFDAIAKRRRVFKVETIGDCYVAVAGLPKPRNDHAITMCRFANDCLHKMQELTKVLATELGQDTCDLCFRVGLHSGPVTAGVLRGDKGRFQLFGDTMNTASRMESTGVKNKIQVSQETADLLVAAGYQSLLTPREDVVFAKGKGNISTFFVNIVPGSSKSTECMSVE